MYFAFTEEQRLLKDSVEKLVANDYSFPVRRELAESELGYSAANWRRFAELGWLALALPEAHGGYGGAVETSIVAETLGTVLGLEPFLSTVVLGGALLTLGGGPQAAALLPKLAVGELKLALAVAERHSRYDLSDVAVTAAPTAAGYTLNGSKSVVFHGESADWIGLSARTSGDTRSRHGITAFVVARDAPGLSIRGYRTVDGMRAAEIDLRDVAVGANTVLGQVDRGYGLIEQVVDAGIVALCAEAVGIMSHMQAATLEYLRGRRQFDKPLASFQALQHRVVDMFVACELSRSMAYMAAVKLGEANPDERRRAVSAAKVQIGEAGKLVGEEAIQLHGGMGMTDEMAISHYFKRLTMIDSTFGDTDHHLEILSA